jgi:hypothetical protein
VPFLKTEPQRRQHRRGVRRAASFLVSIKGDYPLPPLVGIAYRWCAENSLSDVYSPRTQISPLVIVTGGMPALAPPVSKTLMEWYIICAIQLVKYLLVTYYHADTPLKFFQKIKKC